MKRQIVFLGLLLTASITTSAFLGFGSKKDAVATIGRETITKKEFETRLNNFPEQVRTTKENKERILDQMINEELLYSEAQKEGYTKKEEYKNQIETLQKQLLISLILRDKIDSKINVTEDEMKAFYEQNRSQFDEIEQRRARHILLSSKEEANNILAQLKKGANFEKLAREKSKDTASAQQGGDIGWFTKGQLVPEFEKTAYGLKKNGDMSGVVQTQFGFHVIKLIDTNVRPKLTYEQVKNQIRQAIYQQKQQQLTNSLIEELKKEHKVSRDLSKIEG